MYLFFVRHFNDIDHTTPIVWKLLKNNYPVAIYCMNSLYDIRNDYRLQFLKSRGVTVDYLHEAFNQQWGFFFNIIRTIFKKCDKHIIKREKRQGASNMLVKLIEILTTRLRSITYKWMRRLYYDADWAYTVLKQTGARVICFDHVMPTLYFVDAFLKASHRIGIPSIALPHGVYLYTNEATKPKATEERRLAKFNRLDFVIVANELRKSVLIRSGVDENKIFVLGSARYCSEWLEENRKILPRASNILNRETGKLKVVLMCSKPQCRVDVERMLKTCALLAELDGIEALIKPHTRSQDSENIFRSISLPDVSHVLTAELCEWADVLLNVGSSVITEALMRGKPALYLKYLHKNTTLFEELGSCWTINTENELKEAILSLKADKHKVPYSNATIASFLSEVVYGGNDNRDVLGTYERFIVDCASKREPVAV